VIDRETVGVPLLLPTAKNRAADGALLELVDCA
jgi:hypothetical protein